ncbi:ATP-binding protein [Microbacterium enclense]|uniref:ATP-binding protein n=1 Tax=Microbacterium enclense TaxID=993073 RepID=UPI003F816D43
MFDVKSPAESLIPAEPVQVAFRQIAELTRLGVARNRQMAKRHYRAFHIELINVPVPFEAASGSASDYLNEKFGARISFKRLAVFGVNLTAGFKEGNVARQVLESVGDMFLEAQAPISDYDADFELVDAAFNRAGLPPITADEYRWMNAWWNRGVSAATPYVPHFEHMHFFRTMPSYRRTTGEHILDGECDSWQESTERTDMTFAGVESMNVGYVSVGSEASRWCSELMIAGARCVSIRGLIEPAKITQQELTNQKRTVQKNMDEALALGRTTRAEHEQRAAELQEISDAYAVGRQNTPPSLTDMCVTVAFDGVIEDVSTIPTGLTLNPLQNRQPAAWVETMLCSPVRANPYLHDVPSTAVSYSGLPDLSKVGDTTGKLAMIGFTERDAQPAYISSSGASDSDTLPILAICSATGSGKSQLLQWLAYQWALLGVPQIIVDPKEGSDMSPLLSTVPRYREYSMDQMIGADGGLDPIRMSPNKETGVQLASSVLRNVNPWESRERRDAYMTAVTNAIAYGVQQGATATGQALRIAERAGVADKEMTHPIWQFWDTYSIFHTMFGVSDDEETPLTSFDGLTYIKVGDATLQLPSQAKGFDIDAAEPAVRLSTALIRMQVRGSVMALSGRRGVAHFDEAWMVESSAKDELDRVGRLARQKNVLLAIYTQTPSGPLESGLGNYTSRFLNGMITDEDEARAGMDFADISHPDVFERIKARKGSPQALGAMKVPGGVRGSVFYHRDLNGGFAPVEVVLPPDFLTLSGTSPEQQRAREQAAALLATRSVAH